MKTTRSKSKSKRNYAIVGLGGRSYMFTHALLKNYKDRACLAALCDINPTRMDFWNQKFATDLQIPRPIPTYRPDQFDAMIRKHKINTVIVTSMDRTHHRYIIRAMELGCDVITEKPMTIDAPRCQAILDCQKATGREIRVSFNYRYAPHNLKLRELLSQGVVGRVLSVHFEWLLDTSHGADYFRRWHRDKNNSGGLMVHKATHHFDLVNWWIQSLPETVFGFGKLGFYGRENAEERGQLKFYDRCHGSPQAKNDPWGLDLEANEYLKGLYLNAEPEDGYIRDQSVFGHNISIEDDMAVLVRYRNQALMSYHLTAYSPWEGYRVAFNGTEGRLEFSLEEKSYVSGSNQDFNLPDRRDTEPIEMDNKPLCILRRQWCKPVKVAIPQAQGGHGGGDERLCADLFGDPQPDPFGLRANHIDGARSILTGIAANQSFRTGLPVRIDDLVKF